MERLPRSLALACALAFVVAQACSSSPAGLNAPSAPNSGCVETNGAPCAGPYEGTECTGAVCTSCGNHTWALGAVVTCTCNGANWSCPGTAGSCDGDASALYADPSCTVPVVADGGVDADTAG
jgi:hypothetical protein